MLWCKSDVIEKENVRNGAEWLSNGCRCNGHWGGDKKMNDFSQCVDGFNCYNDCSEYFERLHYYCRQTMTL